MPKTIYTIEEMVKILKAKKIPVIEIVPMKDGMDGLIQITKEIHIQMNDDEGYMIVHTWDGKTLTTHGNQFYYEPKEVIKQLQTLLGL